ESLGRQVITGNITGRDAFASDVDLSDLTVRHVDSRTLDYPEVHVRQGLTDRGASARVIQELWDNPLDGRVDSGFTGSVQFDQVRPISRRPVTRIEKAADCAELH